MIEIWTLGETKVAVDGKDLTGEAAWPKSLALIVYMAREPGPDRREEVLGVLWPDRDEKRARRALNQLLYTLRKTSPELDLESVSGAALDFGKDVWLDVEVFEQRLEAGDLEAAVDLYNGPFLIDLGFDEPEFAHWADRQRADLRRKFRKAALKLAQDSKEGADHERAVAYCRRLLESDPLDDEVQHLLIECLYRVGNRLAALRQYERYRELLESELQVEPLEQTLELIEQIKAEPNAGEEEAAAERITNSEARGPVGVDAAASVATALPETAAEASESVGVGRRARVAAPWPTRRGLVTVGSLAAIALIVFIGLQFWPVSPPVELAGDGAAATGASSAQPNVTTHRVAISMSPDGNALTMNPSRLTVGPGDRIWWVFDAGDEWEVDFGPEGPARQRWLAGAGPDSAQAIVRLMAPAATYRYTAAVKIGDRMMTTGSEITVVSPTHRE